MKFTSEVGLKSRTMARLKPHFQIDLHKQVNILGFLSSFFLK